MALSFTTYHEAAIFALSAVGIDDPTATDQLASLLRGEHDTMGFSIGETAELARDYLRGVAGPAGNPTTPQVRIAAVANFRPLAVWCWLVAAEARRQRAIDYIALVAENDGHCYARGKEAGAAVRAAWRDATRRARAGEPVECLMGFELDEIAEDATARVRAKWGAA